MVNRLFKSKKDIPKSIVPITTTTTVDKDSNQIETETEIEHESNTNWSRTKKYTVLLIVSLAGLLAPVTSAIYYPSLVAIRNDLHTTDVLTDLTVSGFLFSMAIAPLAWGSLSDAYGRHYIYIGTILLFILSSLGCYFSNDIYMLLIMRIIQGIGSSAGMVTGMGTISDIFTREERGSALGLFLIGPTLGPSLGPLVGGYINQYLGWRSIFLALIIFGIVLLALIILFLPETLAKSKKQPFPLIITTKSPFIKKRGKLINPLYPLVYLKYIRVSLIILYVSIVFASYYVVTISHARMYAAVYNLNSSQIGLTFIPLGMGNLFGSLISGRISDFLLMKEKRRLGGLPPSPKIRLYVAFVGSFLIMIGLFMIGWFLEFRLPIYYPLISQFLIGFGMLTVFSGTATYLVDLYPNSAASIIACNNCLRTIAASIVTSSSSLIINNLGYAWSFSTFAFLQLPGIIIIATLILLKDDKS